MLDNVYLNGEIVPFRQAAISVWDAGFLHGASTFTTMLAYNGKVFRLDRHLKRLFDTVALLGLRVNVTAEDLTAAVGQLLTANELLPAADGQVPPEARMRITLTPGSEKGGEPVVLITTEAQLPQIKEWRDKGITAVVANFRQTAGDPTYGYKTGCYLPRILARQEAAVKGAQEALWFTTNNHLAEACFRNVFLVLNGRVWTPPRDTPVLPGVVREATLELCSQLGIPADSETPLTVKEMLGAQEVFLTGSGMGVCPVVQIERHEVGDGKPGPITRKLQQAYQEMLDRECAPGK